MSRKEIIDELHKRVRKNFPRRRVITKGIDDLWQADLVEMAAFCKQNSNYKFLLTVIDTFSKYAWAIPLKTKSGIEVADAMNAVFQKNNRIPKHLQTDNGKEFYNQIFKRLMKQKNIKHYSTFSAIKASIVERFNRTLKEKMWKMFSLEGTYKWIDKIEDLLNQYNNTKHRTIQMAPVTVNKRNEKRLLNTVYNVPIKIVKNKYNMGDYVRISKYKKTFDKGYTPNWTTEIFKVIGVNNKFPVTYLLEDFLKTPIAGRFYEWEIQKVYYPNVYLVEKVLKQKGNKAYVKWLGFDEKYNSWINKNAII